MIASRSLLVPEAGLADLAAMRDFVQREADALGMGAGAAQDLVLVVDEVATNIVRHGYQGRPGPIEIEVAGDAHEVVISLRDEAPAFDPTTWPTPDLGIPLDRRPAGGMGIHLTRVCVDRMEHRVREGVGNELVLAFSLAGKGDERHADDR